MASCLFLHIITFQTLHPVSPEPWSAVLKKSAKVLIGRAHFQHLDDILGASSSVCPLSSSRDIIYEGASQARWLHRHAIPVPHVGMAGGGFVTDDMVQQGFKTPWILSYRKKAPRQRAGYIRS